MKDTWLPYIYKYGTKWFENKSEATILTDKDILTIECDLVNENTSDFRHTPENISGSEHTE